MAETSSYAVRNPDDDRPGFNAPSAERLEQWELIRDCLEGQKRIQGRGELYLPKPSAMTDANYAAYKRRAVFFNICERTRQMMVGVALRPDHRINVPDALNPMVRGRTRRGYSIHEAMRHTLSEQVTVGRAGWLIDAEPVPSATNIPYIAMYRAEDIMEWREGYDAAGRHTLTYVRLRDVLDEDDYHRYATSDVHLSDAVLDLRINEDGHYEVTRKVLATAKVNGVNENREMPDEPTVPQFRGQPLRYIPFKFINPMDTKPEVSRPPMLDLADIAIAHYQTMADHRQTLYWCSIPQAYVTGMSANSKDAPKTIGAGELWFLPTDARAAFLEFQGVGAAAQRQHLADLEEKAAMLGARMLKADANRNETAETAKMRGASESSVLFAAIDVLEDALRECLTWACEMVGVPADSIDVELGRDFAAAGLGARDLAQLRATFLGGGFGTNENALRVNYWNLRAGEMVPPDMTEQQFISGFEGGRVPNPKLYEGTQGP